MFGEKDFQQLAVIRRMVARPRPARGDHRQGLSCAPTTASPCRRATPTSRRKQRAGRTRAASRSCDGSVRADRRMMAWSDRGTPPSWRPYQPLWTAGFDAVDYVEDARSRQPCQRLGPGPLDRRPHGLLAVARFGRTRLLDNHRRRASDAASPDARFEKFSRTVPCGNVGAVAGGVAQVGRGASWRDEIAPALEGASGRRRREDRPSRRERSRNAWPALSPTVLTAEDAAVAKGLIAAYRPDRATRRTANSSAARRGRLTRAQDPRIAIVWACTPLARRSARRPTRSRRRA